MPRSLAMIDAQRGVCALNASTGSDRHRGGPLARLVEKNPMANLEFFAGTHWGSETHQVCVVDNDGKTMGERAFRHSGAGLPEMTDWLLDTTNTQPHVIGVAIEVLHGLVVETLMERGFTTHSVNPKQLDRFRDRWSPASAKDENRDVWTFADALRTDGQAFRRLHPQTPQVVELREWSRIAGDITRGQTRLVNRARKRLWRYYPQILKVESNLARPWVPELWSLVPNPEKERRIRTRAVAILLKRHWVPKMSDESVLERLRGPSLTLPGRQRNCCGPHAGGVVATGRHQLATCPVLPRNGPPDGRLAGFGGRIGDSRTA